MRYLIVGLGNIGHKRAAVLGKKCVLTVDPNPNQKAKYKDSKEVPQNLFDCAVLTVPQQSKYELTEYFLSIGKHVLVEKPLILTPAQGKKLSELSKKNGCIWFTSYNHRFEPNIVKLKKYLDQNFIGKLYHARFVYSFGNIKERLNTWRETEFGVLEEIAPHILDFAINFFNYKGLDFELVAGRKVESNIFDHWVFSTSDKKVFLECSSVTWKYKFTIDIYGEKGSLHIDGLRKWGGNTLIVRKRVLPSGTPLEKIIKDSGPDKTWERDFKYFENQIKLGKTTRESDLKISQALAKLSLETNYNKNNDQVKTYKEILK